MTTTNLVVGIAAEYKGKPAFDKANKDVFGLAKGVKQLASAYVGLAGAQKAFRLGQQSLKAFVADDAAAAQLTKTLSNLGLAFNSVDVENFISKTQQATGVLDDLLRPAFQSLLIATRDYGQAQKLLNLSLDIAAGTGKDVTAVSAALSKAYLGNYASLTRLGGGISKATVASGNFNEIITSLSANFKGDAAAAVKTYKGQLDLLKVSTENAKETIGEGLVVALSKISDNNIVNLTDAMDDFATSTAEVIVGIGVMIDKIKSIPGANLLKGLFSLQSIPVVGSYLEFFRKAGKAELKTVHNSKKIVENTKATSKATATTLSATKKLTAEQTKQLALKKSQALLDKASQVFDMDLIQNTAALMGNRTEDETLRLKLQQAILLGNADSAGKLAQELLAAQEAAMKLAYTNPLGNWSDAFKSAIDALKQLQNELALLGAQKMPFWWLGNTTDPTAPGYTDPTGVGVPPVDYGYSASAPSFTYGQGNPMSNVNVNVTMNPDAAKLFITDVVVGNTANGNSNQLTRVTTPWMT